MYVHVCLSEYTQQVHIINIILVHMYIGLGTYHLKVAYLNAKIEVEDLTLISTGSPEMIVQQIKQKSSKENMPPSDENGPSNSDLDPTDQDSFQPLANSIYSRAKDLIRNNKISFNPQMHIFNVQGTKEVRVVKLHPKESCSCPATGTCYHIMGVKLSLGLNVPESTTSSKRNLSRLCKATRSRKEKKTGRKRPRPNDVHIQEEGLSVVNEYDDSSMSKRRKKSDSKGK